jgi:hypothetical protein
MAGPVILITRAADLDRKASSHLLSSVPAVIVAVLAVIRKIVLVDVYSRGTPMWRMADRRMVAFRGRVRR